jgi:SAM-dependent methyltransferase
MWIRDVNFDARRLTTRITQKLRDDGFRAALRDGFRLLARRRTVDDFDLQHDTDTGGDIALWNFKIRSPNAYFGTRYQPTEEEDLADAIAFLYQEPKNFSFIDLGCGKGRTLIVAAKLGFKQVIGVEFAQELVEIARRNLTRMQITNATVVQADAGEYRFPDGDIVVYLFNPFSDEVAQKVVSNLREAAFKRLYVIYAAPECAAVFDESGFLTRLGCPPERDYIQVWSAAGEHGKSSVAS